MGNSQSSSATQFVGDGGLPVGQSFKPCHLFGNPDLYGVGIRVGFYIQYGAAIVAIVFGADKDFRIWRVSFILVSLATFISLCINATSNSLVIVDWAIMIQLVLWFPFFFVLPAVKGIFIEHKKKQEHLDATELAKQLSMKRRRDVSRLEDHRLLIDTWNAYDALFEENGSEDAGNAIITFNRYVHSFEPSAGQPLDPAGRYITEAYSQQTHDLERTSDDLQIIRRIFSSLELRRHHIEALQQMGLTRQEAKQTEAAVKCMAKKEKEAYRRVVKIHAILERIRELGLLDKVSAGISLLIWSAYCFLTPWLFFFGINRGAKEGCDVWVLFVLAPVSVYNHDFVTFLKLGAIVSTIFGVVAFIISVILLAIGLFDHLEHAMRERFGKKGKDPEEQSPSVHSLGEPRAMTTAVILRSRGQESILPPSAVPGGDYHNDVPIVEAPKSKEIDWRRGTWGFILTILLVETITVVEETIRVNSLDLGPPLSSTGQLIALFISVITGILIGYNCFVEQYTRRKKEAEVTVAEILKTLYSVVEPTRLQWEKMMQARGQGLEKWRPGI